jgi:hypothetical protein
MQKFLSFLFVLVFALFIAGCRNDASDGEIQVSNEHVFSDVVKINLANGHNGYSTTITDKTDIENIGEGSMVYSRISSLGLLSADR